LREWRAARIRVATGLADLAAYALSAEVLGMSISVCSLAALLEMKRAAGRPKDLEDPEHLEADG